MRLDDDTWASTSYYTITDAPHVIEVEWQAASGVGTSNGNLALKIDGLVQETLSGKDNDLQNVDYVYLGAVAGIDNGTRGTVYFDDFRARDYIADLFDDGFESGGFSTWSSSSDDNGDLSVTTQAALVGTKGMQAVIDDNNAIYVVDQRPLAEKSYAASFHFDPNSIPMASGDNYVILQGYRSDGVNTLQVYHYYSTSTGHRIKVQMRLDNDTWATTSYYTITDAPHVIEVEWQAASGFGTNNGSLTLKIDGAVQETLTGKDTDQQNVDYVRLGAVAGIDTGTRGTVYFDDFRGRDYTTPLVATFLYDGGGFRVKATEGVTTTVFIGNYFEWTGSVDTMKKYYYIGGQRVAMRVGNDADTAGLATPETSGKAFSG